MSYVGPDFDPQPPRRPRRGPLVMTVAALVAAGVAGTLLWQAVGDAGGSDGAKPSTPGAGDSSSVLNHTPDPAPSGDGTEDAKRSAAPSAPSVTARTSPPSSGGGSGPLRGKVVVIDPGHNPGNSKHIGEINRQVDIGTNRKECDTTGTSTNDGYTEAAFTLDVSRRLRTILEAQGATVRLTQDGDRPWGPCVDERARFGNRAGADAVVSVHADGSGAGNRGFHVIMPGSVDAGGADTRPIVAASRELGERIAGNFLRETGSAPSNYIGGGTGLDVRTDLGGLNLSTVPKVFIECGNMRDAKDAALLTSGAWRQKAAQGISEGIVSFLRG
ncbi:N-acetylmuramoyl-L-alanine amidase [Streptomyces cavernae]|uniref:N-acetylmuramoyl-L-alanine amidase n=1 Tax=Streptomyces cavernae TaxID=2259034 RepID=UPI000FEB64D1|nr:N-acetylmuramoyl-L-alanine amidase [Streptomyces cavernae]